MMHNHQIPCCQIHLNTSIYTHIENKECTTRLYPAHGGDLLKANLQKSTLLKQIYICILFTATNTSTKLLYSIFHCHQGMLEQNKGNFSSDLPITFETWNNFKIYDSAGAGPA